ncbi:unnamed protein product [Heligmosomoides polygyrus]|uniref:Uncharacterized protein n=1 Tax=Heligmosomoides polygyrus TaxID=6339 RepID=A0A183FJH7_HELPZ|nr:unnamed protein product [Heligmosomoides polygyrus]
MESIIFGKPILQSVITHLAMNIEMYKSPASRIRHLRLKRCRSVPAFIVFVAYAPTSDHDEELDAGTNSLEWNEQGERLSQFIMLTKTIQGNHSSLASCSTMDLRIPKLIVGRDARSTTSSSIATIV